ncbi:hypothetical protein H9Q72_008030 [Fusarium xylarioides]|uniref:Uncharacterized protein n=1 Tax=Fusarium xylarioides TaxID=221167 RepID=A0A9P7HUK9_9HYPO|nr:hypothetical protein H9Q70_001951 [Fusarium xylarioides]KAG5763900.1 hypothetical protein H9Q72_008030 [Fusarium xylarioides]KAG5786138.1 hypothetical protein H9Q73_000268 [Fusarium xylarioides]
MSSSGDGDEVESVALSEPTEFESDIDHDSDLYLDSDADSDFTLADLDERAFSRTMCSPTCGLCRFEFVEGEEFVVYKPESKLYPRIWYGKYDPSVPRRLAIELGYHQACVALIQPRTLNKNWQYHLFEVTGGDSDYIRPPSSWTKRRTQWIKQTIATDLRQALGGRLPEEIYQHIASFCVRERACQLLRDLWRDHSSPDNIIKRLYIGRYTSVWAQHVEVEGLRYVKSLSTRRLTQQDTLVFKARFKKRSATNRPEAFPNIYYSQDHLGIRGIIITEDEGLPPLEMEMGLSWAVHRHQKTPFRFTLRDDHIKLRHLTIHGTINPDFTYLTRNWGVLPENFGSFPQIPLATDSHFTDRLYFESVRAVDWNSPGVCGYSFYVEKDLIRGIVSHKLGEPETRKRDEYGTTDNLWFHMPIDPDERVSELWLRRGKHESIGSEDFETLIVRTTKGRSFTPGLDSVCSFPIGETRKFRYKAIAIFPPEGPSRMFYCRAKHLWTYFAFEQASQLSNKGNSQGVASWGNFEIDHSFPPSFNPLIDLYSFSATSASLNDVRTITPCRGWSEPFLNKVVGLLFTYRDGRRRCVGRVRLDSLDPPLTVYSDSFWLGCTDENGEAHLWLPWHNDVTTFCLSEPAPNEDVEYIKVPLSGRLEWAVLPASSAVHHVEEGEPCDGDEISQVMADRKEVLDYASTGIKSFAVPIRVMETES